MLLGHTTFAEQAFQDARLDAVHNIEFAETGFGLTFTIGTETVTGTAVRAKCNSMQAQVDGAADVDALATLFTYTDQGDGSVARPLGEFPDDPNAE